MDCVHLFNCKLFVAGATYFAFKYLGLGVTVTMGFIVSACDSQIKHVMFTYVYMLWNVDKTVEMSMQSKYHSSLCI